MSRTPEQETLDELRELVDALPLGPRADVCRIAQQLRELVLSSDFGRLALALVGAEEAARCD